MARRAATLCSNVTWNPKVCGERARYFWGPGRFEISAPPALWPSLNSCFKSPSPCSTSHGAMAFAWREPEYPTEGAAEPCAIKQSSC